jgi:uncharacterized protein YbbK (DUF523 family)
MNPRKPSKKHDPQIWMVSACLLGFNCRYNGESSKTSTVKRLSTLQNVQIVPICPEAAGGLSTPRDPATIHHGDGHAVLNHHAKVVTCHGEDVSDEFRRGADLAVQAATTYGATHACLKARSPSCGTGRVHTDDGLCAGDGVAAAALIKQGLRVFSDEDFMRDEGEAPGPMSGE